MTSLQNPTPLLDVRGLSKTFALRSGLMSQLLGRRQNAVHAVDDVTFQLAEQEILGLVGESGSGKTTVGRMIVGLESPTAGQIAIQGEQLSGLNRDHLNRKVQMIFQNPYESLDPRYTVGNWISEPYKLLKMGNAAAGEARMIEIMEAVGLRPAATYQKRFTHELSGGQRQRVDIARAMMVSPRLIVADEPVSMLDVSVRSGVLKLILDLRERMGVGYVFISHDLAVSRYVSDRLAVMYRGRIVELGPADSVIGQSGHPYTKMLIAAVPDANPTQRRVRVVRQAETAAADVPRTGCHFRSRCPLAKPVCAEVEPPKLEFAPGHWAACHFAEEVAQMPQLSVAARAS